MSVSVARSITGGSTTTTPSLQLYIENAVLPTPPSALAINSVALGAGATANAPGSLAIGDQSLSRIHGAVVQANGRFASSGDAQAGRYLLRSHTVSIVETELFIDGTGGLRRLVLPDDSTWTFKVTITGHRTDVSDGHAGFSLSGVIYRTAGAASVSFQGSVAKEIHARSNLAWDVQAYADPTYGSLKITVTGEASKIIRWVALVETVEITN